MAAKYTNSPITKDSLNTILSIPRAELPDPYTAIYPILYAADTGIPYIFNPSTTSNGLPPVDGGGAIGRWQPLYVNNGWEFKDTDFTAKPGGSYLYTTGGALNVTFPPLNQLIKGQTIRLLAFYGTFRIDSNSVQISERYGNSPDPSSPRTGSYGGSEYVTISSQNTLSEYVYNGSYWIPTTDTFTWSS